MRRLLFWACIFLATGAARADDDSSSSIFDKSFYTNSPKTGQRVDQYKKEKTPYRDPNALFDSPHSSYPFYPDSADMFFGWDMPWLRLGDMYDYEALKFEGSPTDLYPFDGDPNVNRE